MERIWRRCWSAFASFCLVGSAAVAGDLQPPGGAVGQTMKSLDEVEPRIPIGPDTTPGDETATYVIREGGSYYLTGPMLGEPGKDGIRIEAYGVSLDLSGFAVRGVSESWTGILVTPGHRGIHISNGTVSGWQDGDGIFASEAIGSRFDDLIVRGNGYDGLVAASASEVHGCVATSNGQAGFFLRGVVTVTDCTAEGNGTSGILVLGGEGGSIRGCTSTGNAANGFAVSFGSISNCDATGNGGIGFRVGFDSGTVALDHCAARLNGTGFEAAGPVTFDHCNARFNTFDGFAILESSALTSCLSASNGDDGFEFARGSTAFECASHSNGFGFYVPAAYSVVRLDSCIATGNTNAGFLVSGSDCVIVRNFSRLNGTDYSLSASTQYGQIVAAGGLIPADPWANFGATSKVVSEDDRALIQAKDAEAAARRAALERGPAPARTNQQTKRATKEEGALIAGSAAE